MSFKVAAFCFNELFLMANLSSLHLNALPLKRNLASFRCNVRGVGLGKGDYGYLMAFT